MRHTFLREARRDTQNVRALHKLQGTLLTAMRHVRPDQEDMLASVAPVQVARTQPIQAAPAHSFRYIWSAARSGIA
jgi:hypothetical protein